PIVGGHVLEQKRHTLALCARNLREGFEHLGSISACLRKTAVHRLGPPTVLRRRLCMCPNHYGAQQDPQNRQTTVSGFNVHTCLCRSKIHHTVRVLPSWTVSRVCVSSRVS